MKLYWRKMFIHNMSIRGTYFDLENPHPQENNLSIVHIFYPLMHPGPIVPIFLSHILVFIAQLSHVRNKASHAQSSIPPSLPAFHIHESGPPPVPHLYYLFQPLASSILALKSLVSALASSTSMPSSHSSVASCIALSYPPR